MKRVSRRMIVWLSLVLVVLVGLAVVSVRALWRMRVLALYPAAIVQASNETMKTNAPIVFYGQLTDQSGAGVGGVEIEGHVRGMTRTLDPRTYGVTEFVKPVHAVSDEHGCFTIEGYTGRDLELTQVSKPGYIAHSDTHVRAGYGPTRDPREPIPDPAHPRILHMWRRSGENPVLANVALWPGATPEAESWEQVYYVIRANGNGFKPSMPHFAKLRMTVSRSKPVDPTAERGAGTHRDWSFSIEMLEGGGIAESTDPFMFLAPDEGYQTKYSVDMKATDPSWKGGFNKRFYLRGAEGTSYSVLFINFTFLNNAGPSFQIHDCYANPNGSHNLEHEGRIPH